LHKVKPVPENKNPRISCEGFVEVLGQQVAVAVRTVEVDIRHQQQPVPFVLVRHVVREDIAILPG
jgi:hypothetical protein